MSDRERLEGLRTHLQNVKRWEQKTTDGWKPSVLGEWRHDDVEWLIQQAERVAELEKRLDTEVESGYQMEGQLQDAKAENARLRKALKFYADEENQRPFHDFDPSPYMSDGGKNARRALKGECK